ncbi:MAG TPA: hypothetical protein VNS10_16040 [Gemmatimonadaceae bacterium]|nr:hypothetical protein [Gemmatimonadaceae bacterium]
MKKLIMAVVLVAACRTSPPVVVSTATRPATGNATGGADAQGAIRAFMAAAKQQDLQALGGVWGNANGPARDAISREELEKRELIMMRCLRHDRYDIAGEAPNPGGSRAMVVNLTYKDVSRSTNFVVVRGPANRWYVEKFDLDPLQGICLA